MIRLWQEKRVYLGACAKGFFASVGVFSMAAGVFIIATSRDGGLGMGMLLVGGVIAVSTYLYIKNFE